jgi:hypothetical protein
MAMSSATLRTADERLKLPMGRGKQYELVNGKLVATAPASSEHGGIVRDIGYFTRHVTGHHKLGKVYAGCPKTPVAASGGRRHTRTRPSPTSTSCEPGRSAQRLGHPPS